MPFFSIVIPLFNKENYIKKTLYSVLNQTFTDFEIIIINDGSTDNSKSIVESIQDKRIKFFSIKNRGASSARNFGIKQSIAKYIAFLDADDIWYDNHLSSTYSLIKEFPFAGMYCNRYNFLLGGKHLKKTVLKGLSSDYKGLIENYFESNLFDPISYTSSVVIPKLVFDDIGIFDKKLRSGQDTYLWTKIALKYDVAIHNKITTTIVKNDNSLSNSKFVKDRLFFLDKFIQHEINNPSLKKFMDLNRYSVALNYKINGNNSISKLLFNKICRNNLSLKQKITFSLPHRILKGIYTLKRELDKKGVFLHLYR